MKQLQITDYEIRNGCYVKAEQPVTNFILIVTKIVQGTKVDFKVEVRKTDSEVYTKTISLSQLKLRYFLNDLPVYIEEEKEFYVLVRKAILQKEYTKEEIVYQTNCNGLQEVNGEKLFVFTNCSIGTDAMSFT